jgi:hypothetical protein
MPFRKPELLHTQCNRAVFGRFLRESKEKRPKTAMEKTASGFCGFVADSKCLDFSEIGIPDKIRKALGMKRVFRV